MDIFVPIVLLGILLIVTILLILADRALGGNEEKTITVNDKTDIPVEGSDTLLNNLSDADIFIPSACGGKATCGLCKVTVKEGGGERKPTEDPFLNAQEKAKGVRLSCQVKVRSNMKIEIPEGMMEAIEYRAKVIHTKDLTYDTKLVRFKLIEPKEISFKPGQFCQLKVPGLDVIRAYSIASDAKVKDTVEFIVRLVPKGKATTFVHKAMLSGDEIILTGPYGDFYLQEDSDRDIVMIAGGSGKAPIRSIMYRMQDLGMPRKVKYFFGARTTKDLYYTEEFKAIEKKYDNFEYIPALSDPEEGDGWEGEVGLITDVLDRLTGDLSQSEAYLCGSPGMIDACIKVLNKHNIPKDHVFYDKFD